ncbi:transcriptional regulator GutM [Shigella flexneri]
MVSALITVAAITWCLQLALVAGKYPALTGRLIGFANRVGLVLVVPAGVFKPRVVVAIALNEQQRVTDTLFMKGLTVFARPGKNCHDNRQTS